MAESVKNSSNPNPGGESAAAAVSSKKTKPNPFGAARPREEVLEKKGVDVKALDEKIEERLEQLPSTMTAEEKEKYKELADALTELKLKVDSEDTSAEDRAQAAKDLEVKQQEKRDFVKGLRRTKVATRYRPPAGTSAGGPGAGHHNNRPRHQQHSNENNAKLYVGDLDASVTDDVLAEAFSMFGRVQDAEVCKHRETGYSRGYGFVTMGHPEQAARALMSLTDSGGRVPFQRSPVRVNYANNRRRDVGPPGGGRGGRNYGGYNNNYRGGNQGGSYGRQDNRGGYQQHRYGDRDSSGRQEAFQNFGSNGRYRNNGGGYQQQIRGGYSNHDYNQGRQGGYQRSGDRYGNSGNNNNYRQGGYQQRGYNNNNNRGNYNDRSGSSNWQQQKDRGYNSSQNYIEDQGDHAMMDRMLEGDMY